MAEPSELEQAGKLYDERLQLNVGNELNYDPARSMRVLGVAAETGLPLDVIDASLDTLEVDLRKADFSASEWRKTSPKFAEFAAKNPYNLAVLKDDEESLSAWERAWRPINLGWESTWAQVESSRIGARHASGNFQEGDTEKLAQYEQLLQEHDFGAENIFSKSIVWTAKNLGPTIYALTSGADEAMLGLVAGATLGGYIGGGATLPAGGIGAIPGVITGGLTGAAIGAKVGMGGASAELITGEAYNNYRRAGLSHENSAIAAKVVGAAGGALEVVSIGALTKYIPGVKQFVNLAGDTITDRLMKDVLKRKTVSKSLAMAGVRYGEIMGIEIAVEVVQDGLMTATQNILAEVENVPGAHITMQQYGDQVANTIIETAKAVIYLSAIGPVSSFPKDLVAARNAEKMEAVYLALGDATKDSKLRQKVPTEFRKFVEAQTAEGPVENILIDPQRFVTYFQDADIDPEKVAKQLGVNLEEALELGHPLEIPIVAYAEQIAPTEHHSGLVRDLKSNYDQMSAREAEEFRNNNPEIIESMEKVLEPEIDDSASQEMLNDLTGQLVSLGYDPETATTSAQVLLGIPNLAERVGIDPLELYKERLEAVRPALPEGVTERQDVDMNIDPLLDRLRARAIPTQRDIFGESLLDFIVAKGGLKPDPELDARDFLKQMVAQGKMGAVRLEGDTLDGLAELAHEAGYIPARDPDMLLEAIDRELAGEPQFGTRQGDADIQELASKLEEAAQFFEMEGIDLEELTNVEVRKLLEGISTLEQVKDDGKQEWLQMFEALIAQGNNPELLAQAVVRMPRIAEQQDFSGVTFTDRMRLDEFDEDVFVEVPAQEKFDEAVERRNVLKRLMDCVDGA